jgi:hypothetical protein
MARLRTRRFGYRDSGDRTRTSGAREVQSAKHHPAIEGSDAHDANDDTQQSDGQRGNSHVCFHPIILKKTRRVE